MSESNEVWQTLQAMNLAWTSGRVGALADYFHPDMVAIVPTTTQRLDGRAACIVGWIHSWREIDPKVQIYGNTAVVTYYYQISFDMGGKTHNLGGRDMLVFVKESGRWWVVADQFSGNPGPS